MAIQNISGPQGNLVVESIGDESGTPVIFVHSDMGNRGQWRGAMTHIAGTHRAIAFDRRGHGESEAPQNGDYSIESNAQDVMAVADALGIDRFVLVGHSGGGAIAFVCAAQHAERVAGLLLADPSPDPAALPPGLLQSQLDALQGKDYEKTLLEYYGVQAGPDQGLKDLLLATARATPKQTGIGTLKAFIDFRPQTYPRYTGPAIAIIQSQFNTAAALHRIGEFDYRCIDGVGHWLHLGDPQQFHDMLDEFLHEIEADQSATSVRPAHTHDESLNASLTPPPTRSIV